MRARGRLATPPPPSQLKHAALRSARTLEGLCITGWDRRRVRASAAVLAYYQGLGLLRLARAKEKGEEEDK